MWCEFVQNLYSLVFDLYVYMCVSILFCVERAVTCCNMMLRCMCVATWKHNGLQCLLSMANCFETVARLTAATARTRWCCTLQTLTCKRWFYSVEPVFRSVGSVFSDIYLYIILWNYVTAYVHSAIWSCCNSISHYVHYGRCTWPAWFCCAITGS